MTRAFVTLLVLVAASAVKADDSAKKTPETPIGTWTCGPVGETIWSIEVEQDRLTLKGDTAGKIFRMNSPSYEISKEGVLHGYIREITYTEGDEITSQNKVLFPFAFRLKADKDGLSLSDVRIFAADQGTHQGLTGTFRKEADKNAARPVSPSKELKR